MTSLNELQHRFDQATRTGFRFLEIHHGYAYCGVQVIDPEDQRDAALLARYHRGNKAIDISVAVVAMPVAVYIKSFAGEVRCDLSDVPLSVINLELAFPHPLSSGPPLKWMRKQTLREEALAGFNRYARLMDTHFDQALAYLGLRLKEAQAELRL